MANVSVIGAGSFGTAISISLSSGGNSVTLWARKSESAEKLRIDRENSRYLPGVAIPENVKITSEISECVDCDIIVFAIPSHTIRSVSKLIAPFVKPNQIIVSISKGFDEEKYIRLSEVILEEIPQAKVLAMSGPSHAEEVARALPTTNVVASSDKEAAKFVQQVFNTDSFRIYTSDDIIGVELGGAIKNVIALCAGICDGLGYGDNTKAALITRGIAEITRLGIAMGAKFETFSGLSGIGDLIVTCTSMHSRNRRAGILIGKGMSVADAEKEVDMVVEGIKAAKAVNYLSKKYGVEMPISNEAYRVLFENGDVKNCLNNLMRRSLKSEV